jgi:hypothetical protein
MTVKDREEAVEAISRTEAALREATSDLEEAKAAVLEALSDAPQAGIGDLVERFGVSEEALIAFLQTASELLGDRPLSVQTARRAALVAASGAAWENEVGPLLSSAQVRELLGDVSRQRVDELLRGHRLIGLRDSAGRRRFPSFQFRDARPLEDLVAAYWTLAEASASDWTAASWCTSPDDALDGLSPAQWVHAGADPERLHRVARQDAARLAQ